MKPRVTLAIDRGNNTGIAWGIDGRLFACALAAPGDPLDIPRGFATTGDGCTYEKFRCLIEYPKFYGCGAYKKPSEAYGKANSLIREAVTLGRWTERATLAGAESVEEILPRTWKGTMPKRGMLRMIVERMTPAERRIVNALGLPKSSVHNVLDAIGIMFWSVGRLEFKEGE